MKTYGLTLALVLLAAATALPAEPVVTTEPAPSAESAPCIRFPRLFECFQSDRIPPRMIPVPRQAILALFPCTGVSAPDYPCDNTPAERGCLVKQRKQKSQCDDCVEVAK